jgi:hypothetical protein
MRRVPRVLVMLTVAASAQQFSMTHAVMTNPSDPSIIWHQLAVAQGPQNPALARLLANPDLPSQIMLPYQACELGHFADC